MRVTLDGLTERTYDGAAALVCLTDPHRLDDYAFVWWDTIEEALEADRLLLDAPCGPRCHGRHLVAMRDGEQVRVVMSRHEPTTTREVEMVRCYGVHEERRLPPPDPECNAPFPTAATVLDEWAEDDAAHAVSRPEMDDADRWLMENDKEYAQ